MCAISDDPPLTLAEAARRRVPRVRWSAPNAAGEATMPSAGCVSASAI
jgi:hypothetical protein